MKQRRKRNHNSIEVENEITYGESIVNKSRVNSKQIDSRKLNSLSSLYN